MVGYLFWFSTASLLFAHQSIFHFYSQFLIDCVQYIKLLTWCSGFLPNFYIILVLSSLKQELSVVLFIVMYKVFLMFDSVDEILKCDH